MGADVHATTTDGLTPLIVASARDRPASVKRILESRAIVNVSSLRGQSALLMAAAHDLPDVVRPLIMWEANVNHANAKSECALELAEKNLTNGSNYAKEIKDLLTKAGAVMPKGGKKKKKGKKK